MTMKKAETIALSVATISLMVLCGCKTCAALLPGKLDDDAEAIDARHSNKTMTLLRLVGASVQWLQNTAHTQF